MAVTIVAAAVFAFEWISIGVVAHPGTVNDYHFGSEAMLDKGGWHYRSATTYATVNLVEGILWFAAAILFVVPAVKGSWWWLPVPYAAVVLLVALNQMLL